MNVKIAKSDEDILKCWKAVNVLRPHLNESDFLKTIREMNSEGYILAFVEENGVAAAIAGFRYLQYLFNGKHIYIDDLSTLPEYRGKGYASQLLDYIFNYAKEKGYKVVTLDSGYHRTDAHRLYLNKGFTISSHHFTKKIDPENNLK